MPTEEEMQSTIDQLTLQRDEAVQKWDALRVHAGSSRGWVWRMLAVAFGLTGIELDAMDDAAIEAKVVEYEQTAQSHAALKAKADAEAARVTDQKAAARERLKNKTSADPEADLRLVEG